MSRRQSDSESKGGPSKPTDTMTKGAKTHLFDVTKFGTMPSVHADTLVRS